MDSFVHTVLFAYISVVNTIMFVNHNAIPFKLLSAFPNCRFYLIVHGRRERR